MYSPYIPIYHTHIHGNLHAHGSSVSSGFDVVTWDGMQSGLDTRISDTEISVDRMM